jgi:hypothetical protein
MHKGEREQPQSVSAHVIWRLRRYLQRRAAHKAKVEARARSGKKDTGGVESTCKTTELMDPAGVCVPLVSPSHSVMTKRRPRKSCALRD